MAEDSKEPMDASIAETAFRLMHFIVTTERKNRGTELKSRQDVLSLYAMCHRVARGEPFVAAGQPGKRPAPKTDKPAKPVDAGAFAESEAEGAD